MIEDKTVQVAIRPTDRETFDIRTQRDLKVYLEDRLRGVFGGVAVPVDGRAVLTILAMQAVLNEALAHALERGAIRGFSPGQTSVWWTDATHHAVDFAYCAWIGALDERGSL